MKKICLLLVLSVVTSINAQSKASVDLLTKTEWINRDLDYLRFDDDAVVYSFDNNKQQVFFDLKNKNLSFKVNYRVGDGFKTEEFKFRIKEINKNRLIIEPEFDGENEKKYNKLDVKLFSKEKQYVFYNRGRLLSRVSFKKLTFHSSTCFGTCPSVSVEVDADGTVYYRGKTDANVEGDYVGKLSKQDIYQLRKILNRSQLRAIEEEWKQKSKRTDTPRYTYLVDLVGGETIEINTNDQHPVLDKLSNFLINIDKKAALKEAETGHDFKRSKNVLYRFSQ